MFAFLRLVKFSIVKFCAALWVNVCLPTKNNSSTSGPQLGGGGGEEGHSVRTSLCPFGKLCPQKRQKMGSQQGLLWRLEFANLEILHRAASHSLSYTDFFFFWVRKIITYVVTGITRPGLQGHNVDIHHQFFSILYFLFVCFFLCPYMYGKYFTWNNFSLWQDFTKSNTYTTPKVISPQKEIVANNAA